MGMQETNELLKELIIITKETKTALNWTNWINAITIVVMVFIVIWGVK